MLQTDRNLTLPHDAKRKKQVWTVLELSLPDVAEGGPRLYYAVCVRAKLRGKVVSIHYAQHIGFHSILGTGCVEDPTRGPSLRFRFFLGTP